MEKHKDPRMPLAPSGWWAYLAHQITEKVLGGVVNLLPDGMMLPAANTITIGRLY